MMHLSFQLSPIVIALLSVSVAAGLVVVLWQWLRTRRLARFVDEEPDRQYADETPGVSVIVYAHNDIEWLEKLLPEVLGQDYPEFEVIVVDDGSYDGSKNMLSDMLPDNPRLRVSFIPENTRSLSRKKLSIMLGLKAARYDYVVTTNANCRPAGDQWLRTMMRNFVDGVDVVIGFSQINSELDDKLGRRYRIFDRHVVAMQYLGSAIAGKPYRGVSDNLAYSKKAFFDNSGFSNSLDLKWGDDDIFISEIARDDNTRVEVSPDAQMHAQYHEAKHAHRALKMRRDFTSHFVSRRKPFVVQGVMSTLNYASLFTALAAAAIDWSNWFTLALAAVALLIRWIAHTPAVTRQLALLGEPKLRLTVPFFTAWRPVVNLIYRIRGHKTRKSNYTSIFD